VNEKRLLVDVTNAVQEIAQKCELFTLYIAGSKEYQLEYLLVEAFSDIIILLTYIIRYLRRNPSMINEITKPTSIGHSNRS
jgi:hypothetical protein